MRIANNIMAMNTHRSYTINNNNISKSAEKLSSGYRVNRAGDDAAGLAISEKMRSQIRGLNMASKNSQDGNSMIQTAEGALQEVHSILQRMNELSVQSATGTNQTLDRNALNQEFQQLVDEIDDIASQTTFNDMNLLDGSYKVHHEMTTALPAAGALTRTQVVAQNLKNAGNYTLGVSGDKVTLTRKKVGAAATDPALETITMDLKDLIQNFDLNGTEALKAGESFFIDLTTMGLGSYELKNGTAADITAVDVKTAVTTMLTVAANDTDAAKSIDKALKIQVGAKEGEQMNVDIDEVSSSVLGLSGRSIATQDDAGRAVSITRSAINQVSTVRAALGAAQNRLDHKIANLGVAAENLQAAESRIRDVDMASEMTNFTKNNILSQAATSMLAQANALPQNVLSLLR